MEENMTPFSECKILWRGWRDFVWNIRTYFIFEFPCITSL